MSVGLQVPFAFAVVLAIGTLAIPAAAQAEPHAPENVLRASWSPDREQAVVVEVPGGEEPEPAPGASRSLLSQRPERLSAAPQVQRRETPMRAARWQGGGQVRESLPSAMGEPVSPEGLPVPQSAIMPGEDYFEQGGHSGPCMPNCCGNWQSCGPVPLCCLLPRPPLENFEFVSGVQGFTGPANRGGSGSFGFHEGINWGIPFCCMAWQWGATWTQSNFDGNYLTTESRDQTFVTGGLFRRVDWGFQGGLVVDFFHDRWDYTADLLQLRGELSWVFGCECQDELGFWFTSGMNDQDVSDLRVPTASSTAGIDVRITDATFEVNDIYAFFYRRQFCSGGQGRVFGGVTSNSQGLVGADFMLPLNQCWSVRSNFLYAGPQDDDTLNTPRFQTENWNVGISLVWTPCPRTLASTNYFRPLFNVADNGSFLTRLVE